MVNEPTIPLIRSILYNKLSFELNESEVAIINSLPVQKAAQLLQKEFYDARDHHIAWRAFCLIKNIKPFDKVQFILALIRYSSSEWRAIYCQSLAEFHDQRALHVLCSIYKNDYDTKLRYKVADLLAAVGDESIIDIIEAEQFTDDRFDDFPIASVTRNIIQQIRERLINGSSPMSQAKQQDSIANQNTQPLLEQWMNETDQASSLRLFKAVFHDKEFDKIQWLSNLLDKSTIGWRNSYVQELSNYQEQRAIESLIGLLLQDPDSDLRYTAAQTLGSNGDASAIAALTYAVNHDLGTDYEGRPISVVAAQAIEMIQARMAN